jgi:acetyl-CoA acetyltransferase
MRRIGLVEMNEAFAAVVLANVKAFASDAFARDELGRSRAIGAIDPDRLNVNGGAIALGHPVGATGARLVLTALLEMRRRDVELGLVTLCIGGGQGGAVLLERA